MKNILINDAIIACEYILYYLHFDDCIIFLSPDLTSQHINHKYINNIYWLEFDQMNQLYFITTLGLLEYFNDDQIELLPITMSSASIDNIGDDNVNHIGDGDDEMEDISLTSTGINKSK